MTFRVEPARPQDVDAVFGIYNHAIVHSLATMDSQPRDAAAQRAWWEQHQDPRYPALVARTTDGTVAGWATLSPWSTRLGYTRCAESSVYVHQDFHRSGVGRMLMRQLLEQAPNHGVFTVLARMVEDNHGSVKLHQALGFHTVGIMHRVGEKFGRVLDVRLMEKHLDR